MVFDPTYLLQILSQPYLLPYILFLIISSTMNFTATIYWMASPPSWLPKHWTKGPKAFQIDAPRKGLTTNLILNSLMVGVWIVFMIAAFSPISYGTRFYLFMLYLSTPLSIVVLISGIICFTLLQVKLFNWDLQQRLNRDPPSPHRQIAKTLLVMIPLLVCLNILWYFGPLEPTIPIVSFGLGLGIIGTIPQYLMSRRWERKNQQKLIISNRILRAEPLHSNHSLEAQSED